MARIAIELSIGLASSGTYGLAMGARLGVPSMAVHAAGVPLCFLVVGALATPAFYIGLAHAGVVVPPLTLARATARGTATAGRVLAGLAPAALLLGVTSETLGSAMFFGALGLALSFWLALRAMLCELESVIRKSRLGGGLSLCFVMFASLLAARSCWLLLPLFGGEP